jgi:DNA-binding transcriptional LysR family regulator
MLPLARRLDLVTIRLFVAAVEERSIAKAAWRESITTSAVSKRLSDLEVALGTQLLMRQRQGVEPTPAGQALLLHFRAVLGRIDYLVADMADYGEGVRGLVRLAANESAAIGYLPADIARFLSESPAVKFDIQVQTSPVVIRMVLENACDIGIFTGDEPTADLHVLPYRDDQLVVLVPARHSLAVRPGAATETGIGFATLLDHGLIGSEAAGAIEALVQRAAARLGRRLDTRIRVSSFDAAARLVEAGLGVTIMTRAVAEPLSKALDICTIELQEVWARRELKICLRRGTEEIPTIRRFLDTLSARQFPLA